MTTSAYAHEGPYEKTRLHPDEVGPARRLLSDGRRVLETEPASVFTRWVQAHAEDLFILAEHAFTVDGAVDDAEAS